MNIEILAIGNEVLYGFTLNANATFLARQLLESGYNILRHEVVGDSEPLMEESMRAALKRRACVVVTGGLGPTLDDLTRPVAAKIFKRKLVVNQSQLKRIRHEFHNPSTAENQATLPHGALIFENHLGTAPGFVLQDESLFPGARLICLPGVPLEMRALCLEQLLPYLHSIKTAKKIFIYPIYLAMISEVEVDLVLRELQQDDITIGIYPAQGTLTIHIQKESVDYETFLKEIQAVKLRLESYFSKNIYTSESGKIEEAVHQLLIEEKLTLATAESCTGGALAARFVSLPDASKYFKGSIVAYANEVKKSHLGVTHSLLAKCGAVSVEVTERMAKSVAKSMQADIGIAVSGIFGPAGATKLKPVGTVCASIFFQRKAQTKIHSWTMHLTQHRELNCERTIIAVISELLFYLRS